MEKAFYILRIQEKKEYLHDLYETGRTDDKKYRFQPEIIHRYKRCIDIMLDVLPHQCPSSI
jgi:proteic killer suppression protein